MTAYWFWDWMRQHRVTDGRSLRRSIARPGVLDSLLQACPPSEPFIRQQPPEDAEITGGKGIDLTGDLGCHHIDCLSKELSGLFQHAWHYFDRIALPDQAFERLLAFKRHKKVDALCERLDPFVLILRKINHLGGLDLLRFDVRSPACAQHFRRHAREAAIDQSFANTHNLARELLKTAKMSIRETSDAGHRHLEYRLDSPSFQHTEWGALCSKRERLPINEARRREAAAVAVVQRYLAAISADALAARRAMSPLGSAIGFYRELLATHPSPRVEDIAFELELPVNSAASLKSLIRLRKEEPEAFIRFQLALRTAMKERLASASSRTSAAIAKQIKREVIEPALGDIRRKLKTSRSIAARSAGAGMALGAIATTVGLMSPLSGNPVGVGLAVGGAITLGMASLKKANDDELAVHREVKLSDMYFLWKAHVH